ncbi:ribonuclease III [Westerdykella ornata]|uniref:Large ribosomal subunit protein mL44 n=1 Tax=Westerdykella ornata TaxID=318751 RepID=A0A6A6JSQ3_WESOR|nr:ribonuclease III [Westerdykella ornata]KAF2279295.1 ribonuclease III [Westerdykella ornata]
MKRIRISRCGTQLLAPSAPRRPFCPCTASLQQTCTPHNHRIQRRLQTTAAAFNAADTEELLPPTETVQSIEQQQQPQKQPRRPRKLSLESLPSPHPLRARESVKLAALRSRLSLPQHFPLPTLARTLVHPSADPDPAFNNASLAMLGSNILSYYLSEHLICNYPRLPMAIIFAAHDAYIGPKALATIAGEWGIEAAAEPGGEVDPGLLQFRRLNAGDPLPAELRRRTPHNWNVTTTHRILRSDEFGSAYSGPSSPQQLARKPIPVEEAAQSFVRALVGSLHLHLGRPTTKRFFRDHFLSRHLDLSTLFDFRTPTRDLSRLCAREGFEPPVARLISETGRASRHPVFVVGVYSGRDKLGEGAGSSLDEARFRAAAAALKSWCLYKPLDVTVPSEMEGVEEGDAAGAAARRWRPNMVDCGEVVV